MTMRCCVVFLACAVALAQAPTPAGKWVSNLKYFDQNDYDHLELELSGNKLTGKLGDEKFEGTFENGRIEGTIKPGPKETIELHGVLKGDRIEGTARQVEDKVDLKWEAEREKKIVAAPRT